MIREVETMGQVSQLRLAADRVKPLFRSYQQAELVAITPGWLRSEMMLDNFSVSEDNWRDALDPARAQNGQPVAPPDFALSESPRYVGRAIVSLALDPDRQRWIGSSDFGFEEQNGS